ncbi:hypothetical protein BD414DRAFT_491915 [Trametes punicea]|nr:hypothetical protein BD414DRAFT_491915 [Trametes punicea]
MRARVAKQSPRAPARELELLSTKGSTGGERDPEGGSGSGLSWGANVTVFAEGCSVSHSTALASISSRAKHPVDGTVGRLSCSVQAVNPVEASENAGRSRIALKASPNSTSR